MARRNLMKYQPLGPIGAVAILLGSVAPASASSVSGFLTRENGMNAIRFAGDTWTLQDLIDRRNLNPGQFDRTYQRLGSALSLGVDGLLSRRAEAPARFDHFHPLITYLLTGVTPPGTVTPPDLGAGGEPDGPEPPGESAEVIPGPPSSPQVPVSPSELPTVEPSMPEQPAPLTPSMPPPTIPPAPGTGLEIPTGPGPGPGTGPGPGPPPGTNPGPGPGPEPPPIPQAIPEPATLLQATIGLLGVGGLLSWRRRRRAA